MNLWVIREARAKKRYDDYNNKNRNSHPSWEFLSEEEKRRWY